MNPQLVTAATSTVLALGDVKGHLRIDTSDLDQVIGDAIASAEGEFERKTGRCLLTSTWDYTIDEWPEGDCIRLPKGQIQSIVSVTYYGTDNQSHVWPATEYALDTAEGEIELAIGKLWPTTILRSANPIVIRFIAGWADSSSVPADIKRALRLHIEYQVDGPKSGGITAMHELNRIDAVFKNACLEYRVEVD